jgi:hypothetical protein
MVLCHPERSGKFARELSAESKDPYLAGNSSAYSGPLDSARGRLFDSGNVSQAKHSAPLRMTGNPKFEDRTATSVISSSFGTRSILEGTHESVSQPYPLNGALPP